MELAQPGLEDELVGNASGRVLLGTVAGDIHDIGKNMAALAFRMFGFTVEDLGVNVPPEDFLEAARALQARHRRAVGPAVGGLHGHARHRGPVPRARVRVGAGCPSS